MRIQHNIMAMNAYRNYTNNTSALSKNLEKLSSGYKINRAGDDAAGLAISEKMRAQITGLDKAQDNAKDGISLVQTAEGALTEVHDMLNRMYELAEQSANGTFEDGTDRVQLQKEVKQLKSEINRIADSANFNGINLLDGSMGVGVTSTIGKAGTGDGVTAGAAGTATTTVLDFSKLKNDLKAGATITVGEKTFELVKDGEAAKTNGAIAVTMGATKDATLTALATGIAKAKGDIPGLAAAAAAGGKITLTSDVPKAGDTNGNKGGAAYEAFKVEVDGVGLTLQIGDTSDDFNQLRVGISDCHTTALGIDALDIGKQDSAADALDTIKNAINYVSNVRGTLGATQNRLDHTINNLSVMEENIQDAESTIRDTDVADEMMAYTKNNILIQSAQAMLAQANQVPQGVLQLLQ